MTVAKTRKTAIKIGTTFYSHYADSASLFTVVAKRGADTYDCEVKAHPEHGTMIDWLGTKKVFGGEEIRHKIATAKMYGRLAKEADDFWASRKVGEIVHYHNGFGQYVRGEIVRVGDQMKMKPIALVGNWTHDLPKRASDGQVIYSYHVKRIRFPDTDSPFQPNDGNMWESKTFSKPMGPYANFNPTTAPALDISDPAPLEGEAAAQATYEYMRMQIGRILSEGYNDPKEALITAYELLIAGGIK